MKYISVELVLRYGNGRRYFLCIYLYVLQRSRLNRLNGLRELRRIRDIKIEGSLFISLSLLYLPQLQTEPLESS